MRTWFKNLKAKTLRQERATNMLYVMAAVMISIAVTSGTSAADERDHRRGAERGRHEGWHGEIHRFNEHDLGRWSAGRWYRGHHAGRLGWWWIVGGVWYYYPAPVYPYPNPYQPPMMVASPAPPTAQFWYYCANPPGYYPYVAQCAGNWQRVPASPPPGMPR
jgi:hypothetical protein